MFLNYASYNRAVSYRVKRGETERQLFMGSSLNRKTNESKESNGETPVAGEVCEVAVPVKIESVVNELRQNPLAKPGNRAKKVRAEKRILSNRSKSKIRDKCHALYAATDTSDFSFITLTFISWVTHREAQKCLNKFLTVLRKRKPDMLYLWVAELQKDNNDRIHFHLITNKRFQIRWINALWVVQQINCGIDNKKASEKLYNDYLGARFTDLYNRGEYETVQKYLNPVDVKKIHDVNGLSGYLTQYISKNKDEFECSTWHCCRGVSNLFTAAAINEDEFAETSDEKINYLVTKKKVYRSATNIVVNKETGLVVGMVNTIYNKKHFKKFFRELDELNRFVLNVFRRYKEQRFGSWATAKEYKKERDKTINWRECITVSIGEFFNLN